MWLLESSVRQAIEDARKSGLNPTAEQQTEYEARITAASTGDASRLLTVAGNSAQISVEGVITNKPSFLAMLFGGGNTTYQDIISAVAETEADDNIDNVTYIYDSPGGSVDGLFDAMAAMQAASKPSKAIIKNVAASAAYALISQADEVIAANPMVRVGSVGIVATFRTDENEISVTSTEAPKKRPDVTTEAGQAVVREGLDALHEIFADAIASGRGTTVEKINAEFGQGATLLAGDALKRGMIDAIQAPALKAVNSTQSTTAKSGKQPETGKMDLKELQAQHPDVYAAAVQTGVDKERDRVTAHLTMGEASGDTETAFSAIKDGEDMTATLQAKYMAAGMNRSDVDDRQSDDDQASGADGAQASDSQGDAGDNVASLVEAKLGMEV